MLGLDKASIKKVATEMIAPAVKVIVELIAFVVGVFVLALLMWAGLAFHWKDYLGAMLAAGIVAIVFTVVQMVIWKLTTRVTQRNSIGKKFNNFIVCVALHYAAIMVGVSFGGVLATDNNSPWGFVVWLIQQTVLSYVACVLAAEYRKSS